MHNLSMLQNMGSQNTSQNIVNSDADRICYSRNFSLHNIYYNNHFSKAHAALLWADAIFHD